MEKIVYDANFCIMTDFFRMTGGKWKSVILYLIRKDINRFSLLMDAMPTISKKVLTQQLREMEQDGLLIRDVLVAKAPMVVVYHLTEKGKSLRQLIDGIIEWNKHYFRLEFKKIADNKNPLILSKRI